jgi:hypothetical protein
MEEPGAGVSGIVGASAGGVVAGGVLVDSSFLQFERNKASAGRTNARNGLEIKRMARTSNDGGGSVNPANRENIEKFQS